MFWLIKKIFWLAVLAGLVYYGAQYQVDGRPLKDYAKEFYESPLVQAVLKTGKEMAGEFMDEKLGQGKPSDTAPEAPVQDPGVAPADHISPDDQKALQRVIDKRQ